jgi:serine/threonine protein kinase
MVQPVRSGSVVARRYRATRRIASGAMGEVWEGMHVELGQRVAIKVLRREALECREMVVRFTREAFLLARIQSEHVVRVLDYVDRSRHGPVLVMELLEGPSFADVVQREHVSVEDAVDVAIDVLRGLQAMHAARVIHRDVKPGNVVLRETHDGKRRAVLIDLGVGRLADDDRGGELTSSDRVVGTLEYMAPEQILDCQNADAAVDVYAVGAMLFRAVAGVHPFGDKRGVELVREKIHRPVPPLRTGRNDAIGRKFEAIVQRAIAFSPSDRYRTADELLGALERLREDIRAVPLVPPLSPLRTARAQRRKVAIALAAAGAALFAACSTEYVGARAAPHDAPAVVETVASTPEPKAAGPITLVQDERVCR